MHQKMRYSDKEIDVIKSAFKDNFDLLIAIRKVMWQIPLSEAEEMMVEASIRHNDAVKKAIRKTFVPELEPEAPLYQVVDLWTVASIKDKSPEQAMPFLKATEKYTEYLNQQLNVLFGEEVEKKIKFSDLNKLETSSYESFIKILTRNTIIQHTETQLHQLQTLSEREEETPEQREERLQKDSTR